MIKISKSLRTIAQDYFNKKTRKYGSLEQNVEK